VAVVAGITWITDACDIPQTAAFDDLRATRAQGLALSAGVAMENARSILCDVQFCQSSYEVAEGADALAILTEWREFRQLNLERIKELMARPAIFDGRNIYDPERSRRLGFEYYSLGRP
jgi:UDPglucose 6-dehydrogenase